MQSRCCAGQQYSSTGLATVQPAALDGNQTWVYGPALAGCVAGAPCQLLVQLHDIYGNPVVRLT